MARLRVLPIPNYNPDVFARNLGSGKVTRAVGAIQMPVIGSPSATSRCTGGNYRCPQGWEQIDREWTACVPGIPCPTYEPLCKGKDTSFPGLIRTVTLPAKEAIQRFLVATQGPLTPGGGSYDLSPWDEGDEKCEWVCPEGLVKGQVQGAPYLAPPCVSPDSPDAAQPSYLGVPVKTWAIGAAAVAGALGLAAVVAYATKGRFSPNMFATSPQKKRAALVKKIAALEAKHDQMRLHGYDDPIWYDPATGEPDDPTSRALARVENEIEDLEAELAALDRYQPNVDWEFVQHASHAPEAALMLMPPAIPSYLAYRYAMRKMTPEEEEQIESYIDVPEEEFYEIY